MWGKSEGSKKNCERKPDGLRTACYPAGNKGRRVLGYILMAAGILVIVFSVPLWAWWGILGLIMIFLGIFLAGM